jgi:hypothetical protein
MTSVHAVDRDAWRSPRRAATIVALLLAIVALVMRPAEANCIAHQPPNARFTPPAAVPLTWDCVVGGPLYEHERDWFIIAFKVTNAGQRRVDALKLQANVVDAFGEVLQTIPIVENAKLGHGDADGAVWAFRPGFDKNSVDHVAVYLLAVKYADGTIWSAEGRAPKTGPTPDPRARLRRFAIRWDTYDMSSEIAPSPSPSPTSSP